MKHSLACASDLERLLSQPLNPLVYYQTLPSDVEFEKSAEDKLSLDYLCDLEELNQLLVLLYLENQKFDEAELEQLALWASRKYSALLASGKMAREQRMKLQLVNYAAQDVLAAKRRNFSSATTGRKVSSVPPWDWLRLDDGSEYLIVSGEMGLQLSANNETKCYDAGLASQLDVIDDSTISVGSIFSNGGFIMHSRGLEKIEHPNPIVLFFNLRGDLAFVDYNGKICNAANGQKFDEINCAHADKVRLIDNKLYIADWSVFGKMGIYDLSNGSQRQVELQGIYLLNDICAGNECFYAVCKQQGFIFKYSSEFELMEKRLSFGKKEHELFDPISIRKTENHLQVLSWVTGNLTCTDIF